MMQNIMFLRSTDDDPIDRIINLDLLSTAQPNPEGEGTIAIVGHSQISMGMPFDKFLAQVQSLIAENYKYSNETSVAWHKKRMEDTEKMMKSAMHDLLHNQ